MLKRWAKAGWLGCVFSGLCLCAQANTTAEVASVAAVSAGVASAVEQTVQNTIAMPRQHDAGDAAPVSSAIRVALLLPLHSDPLGDAAEAVRAGFMAALQHDPDDIKVSVVETGDGPQEIVASYTLASAQHDIVVGPLSRTGVTAVAQSAAVVKPTIALTVPEGGADLVLPKQMLVIGLSIEDEARQIANWAGAGNKLKKAYVLYTPTAWQQRAARAFEVQWQRLGLESESVEIPANDGYLHGRTLLGLKKRIQGDTAVAVFAALDANQARQLRAILGNSIALYGTSQLNPFALSDWNEADRTEELNGVHLLDIPWQLQPDHPAVMTYPSLVVSAGGKRSADMERLYALGIDAYRITREIAAGQTDFQLDGVTGKLKVRFGQNRAQFERIVQQAVYRDGSVLPDTGAQ